MFEERMTRRDALKKAAYITPVILTFLAAPSFASGGSGTSERDERLPDQGGHTNKSGGGDNTNPGGHGNDGGFENPGNGKRGNRWFWDYERDQRRQRKKHWKWD